VFWLLPNKELVTGFVPPMDVNPVVDVVDDGVELVARCFAISTKSGFVLFENTICMSLRKT
jgi:hypothetical protein